MEKKNNQARQYGNARRLGKVGNAFFCCLLSSVPCLVLTVWQSLLYSAARSQSLNRGSAPRPSLGIGKNQQGCDMVRRWTAGKKATSKAGSAVFHPGKIFQRRRTLVGTAPALTVGLGLFGLSLARGQNALQQSLISPGNAQASSLFADDIASWKEGDRLVFMVQGQVVVTQGVKTLRFAQGVVWVDETGRDKTGVYNVEVYSDGAVNLSDGAQQQTGTRGILQLAMRGELNIKTYRNKMASKNLSQDPIYQRAAQSRSGTQGLVTKKGSRAAAIAAIGCHTAHPGEERRRRACKFPSCRTAFAAIGLGHCANPGLFAGAGRRTNRRANSRRSGPAAALVAAAASLHRGSQVAAATRALRGQGANAYDPARSSVDIQTRNFPRGDETAWVVSNGVIVTIKDAAGKVGLLDIEADRMVFWTKGGTPDLLNGLRNPQGQNTQAIEFYLEGNVELRYQNKKETEIIKADRVYYDVARHVAVCVKADLEIRDPKLIYPLHVKADEVLQLNAKVYQASHAVIYSSQLPSDPGLTVEVKEVTVEEKEIATKGIFGTPIYDKKTGEPKTITERQFAGSSFIARIEGVPFFYFPYLTGNVEDPLGPLDAIGFGSSRPFGFQFQTTWDLFDLFGINKPAGERWRLYADYLSRRGPALGTEFDFAGKDLFDIEGSKYSGLVKAYGIHDTATDILGGDRGIKAWLPDGSTVPITHPEWRGRFLARANILDLPAGFTVQTQVSALSDRNFLEQYYANEFLNDLNQETFLYVRQQNNQWQWGILAEPRIRNWVTETEWLPKADGASHWPVDLRRRNLGLQASAGYARLRPTDVPSFAYSVTDQRVDTGRFDFFNEFSVPFSPGALRRCRMPKSMARITPKI